MYKLKYLKYKNKYLELKNKLIGGSVNNSKSSGGEGSVNNSKSSGEGSANNSKSSGGGGSADNMDVNFNDTLKSHFESIYKYREAIHLLNNSIRNQLHKYVLLHDSYLEGYDKKRNNIPYVLSLLTLDKKKKN